jgi:acyl carrier protein
MTKEQMRKETTEIVKRVLKHEDFELTDEMTAGEIKGWDSLSHMVIITEVEKHFNIKLSFHDVLNFNDMSDLFNCILNKIN